MLVNEISRVQGIPVLIVELVEKIKRRAGNVVKALQSASWDYVYDEDVLNKELIKALDDDNDNNIDDEEENEEEEKAECDNSSTDNDVDKGDDHKDVEKQKERERRGSKEKSSPVLHLLSYAIKKKHYQSAIIRYNHNPSQS